MSKPRSGSQPNVFEKTLALGTKMGVTLDVTKDDITAIAVSREELSLKRQIRDFESQIVAANKNIEVKTADRDNQVTAFAQAKFDAGPAVEALKLLGISVNVEVTGSINDGGKLTASVNLFDGKDRYQHLSRTTTHPIPANIAALNDEIDALHDEVLAIQDKIIAARRDLGDLSTLERAARASFAEAALKGTAEGRAMLDMIDGIQPTRLEIVGDVAPKPRKKV